MPDQPKPEKAPMVPCTDPYWGMPDGFLTLEQVHEVLRRTAVGCAEDWAQQGWLLALAASAEALEPNRKEWADAAFANYIRGLDPVVARIAADLQLDQQGAEALAHDMSIVFRRRVEALAASTVLSVGHA